MSITCEYVIDSKWGDRCSNDDQLDYCSKCCIKCRSAKAGCHKACSVVKEHIKQST